MPGEEACAYLSPGIHIHDFFWLVFHFLKGHKFRMVIFQLLLLQGDHDPPAGRRAGAPQQSHVLGHVSRRAVSDSDRCCEWGEWSEEQRSDAPSGRLYKKIQPFDDLIGGR